MAGGRDLLSFLEKKTPSKENPSCSDPAGVEMDVNKIEGENNSARKIKLEQSRLKFLASPTAEKDEKKVRPKRSCVISAPSLKEMDSNDDDSFKEGKGRKRQMPSQTSTANQIHEKTLGKESYPKSKCMNANVESDPKSYEDPSEISMSVDQSSIMIPKENGKKVQMKQLKLQNKTCSETIMKGQKISDMPQNSSKRRKCNKDVDEKVNTLKKAIPKRSPLKQGMRNFVHSSGSAGCNDGHERKQLKLIFNLREEAKRAAEENSRLLAGKETHPFFTKIKTSISHGGSTQVDPKFQSLKIREAVLAPCAPYHITQNDKVTCTKLDWKGWSFEDDTLLAQNKCNFLEDSYEPGKYGMPGIHACGEIKCFSDSQRNLSSLNLDSFHELHNDSMDSEMIMKLLQPLIKYLNKCTPTPGYGLSPGPPEELENITLLQELRDRFSSYYYQRTSSEGIDAMISVDNSLWTEKYRPKCSEEVCGNPDSVTKIQEWLHGWNDHDFVTESSKHMQRTHGDMDPDWDVFQDSSENSSMEVKLDAMGNVLLVTGPIGCGKSAAVYACAEEQGYDVIEINTSEGRNGALVKQKFGEAVESHGLIQRSNEETKSQNISNLPTLKKFTVASSNTKQQNHSQNQKHTNLGDNHHYNKIRSKALILFEDVDTIFDEDRGFIATLLQFAEVSKRPIVLTSNRHDPSLPRLLKKFIVEFSHPSVRDLVAHIYMICMAERASIFPSLLEHVVRFCGKDLRKILFLLQFWCQGKKYRQISESHSSTPFELDAAFCTVPLILPWSFSCKLSQAISTQMSEALDSTKHRSEQKGNMDSRYGNRNIIISHLEETKKMTTAEKKALMLERTCPVNEEMPSISVLGVEDCNEAAFHFSNASHEWLQRRRKQIITDSDDMNCSEPTLGESGSQQEVAETQFSMESEMLSECSDVPSSCPDFVNFNETVESDMPSYRRLKKIDNHNSFETNSITNIPSETESTFVPETVLNDSCTDAVESDEILVANTMESPSGCCQEIKELQQFENKDADAGCKVLYEQESFHCQKVEANARDVSHRETHIVDDLLTAENHGGRKSNRGIHLAEGVEKDVSVLRRSSLKSNEKMGHFFVPCEISQLMDECSRVDFHPRVGGKDEFIEHPVKEAWKKIFNSHENYKTLLSSNCNDIVRTINLASSMADLISSSDLLLDSSERAEDNSDPSKDSSSVTWSEERFRITSSYAEYGFYLVSRTCSQMGPRFGDSGNFNLRKTFLSASSNSIAVGKLITDENTGGMMWNDQVPSCRPSAIQYCSKREKYMSRSSAALETIIPKKSLFSLNGTAFHEYVSFLGKISKLEEIRRINTSSSKRRKRGFRHYLTTRPFSLSKDTVNMFIQRSNFGESFQS